MELYNHFLFKQLKQKFYKENVRKMMIVFKVLNMKSSFRI